MRSHYIKDKLKLSSLLKIINYFNDHLEIQITFCILIQTQKAAIMIHDCIYQFLRIFYHSRFKPQQLEMTGTRLTFCRTCFCLSLLFFTLLLTPSMQTTIREGHW